MKYYQLYGQLYEVNDGKVMIHDGIMKVDDGWYMFHG